MAKELLGAAPAVHGRFPLLIKILDAQDVLSLQVHPPAHKAAELQGEAKTEMWYIADAAPEGELFAGLKRGTTRHAFEEKLRSGDVARMLSSGPCESGRCDVPAKWPRSCARLRAGDLRNPAELRYHLSGLRLEPQGIGRQTARTACGAGAGQH